MVMRWAVLLSICIFTGEAKSTTDLESSDSISAQGVTQKVIDLLKELKGRLTKDGQEDDATFNKFKLWADDETKTAKSLIDEKEDSLEGLNADIERLSATITSSQQALEKAGNDLYVVDKQLQDATSVRDKERKVFEADENKAIDAEDQLTRAVETMSKAMPQDDTSDDQATGLVQKAASSESLVAAAKNLRQVLFEGKDFSLSFSQREMIDGFVQRAMDSAPTRLRKASEQGQDVLAPGFLQTASAQQAAGPYGTYESQAGGVVGILQSSLSKAKQQLSTLRSDEVKAKGAFTQLKGGLEDQIQTKKDDMNRAKLAISEAEQQLATAKTNKLAEKEMLDGAKQRLESVTTELAQKDGDYSKRKALRADELTAVGEAEGILESPKMQELMNKYDGVASFVQLKKTNSQTKPLALKSSATGLALLETKMSARRVEYGSGGSFAKIKTLIQEMLEHLLGEQNKDTEKHGFCTKEMGTTEHELNEKKNWLKKTGSQLEVMDAELVELALGIKDASSDVREIEELMTNATLVRQEESNEARLAIQDYESAKTLLKNAIRMLNKVYGADGKSTQAAGHLKNEESTSSMGGGVIAILEIAVDNYDKLHQETSLADKNAAQEFTELKNSREVQSAKLEKDLEWRQRSETKLKAEKMRLEKDKESYDQQVDALDKMMGTLKKSCTIQGDSYEERKSRREAELKSLKDALDILEGESIP